MTDKLFEDLGFSPEKAAALTLKADLHSKIVKAASGYSQRTEENPANSGAEGQRSVEGQDVQIQFGHARVLCRAAGIDIEGLVMSPRGLA